MNEPTRKPLDPKQLLIPMGNIGVLLVLVTFLFHYGQKPSFGPAQPGLSRGTVPQVAGPR